MTDILTTTLLPYQSPSSAVPALGSTVIPSSYSQVVAITFTQRVTKTLSSASSSDPNRASQQSITPNSSKSGSSVTIGLSIGLPVGLFCLGLVIFLCYFYLGWFNTHGGENIDSKNHFETDHKIGSIEDFMSSRIQYKVTKPVCQHIVTPKVPVYKNPFKTTSSLNIRKDVDTFLYSRPPNIHHIDSRMSSFNDLVKQVNKSSITRQELLPDSPKSCSLDDKTRKWTYQSPLSRWFLRNSTYVEDGLTLPISINTPTFQLKQLKILSRIQKDYVGSGYCLEDERSPILEKSGATSQCEGNAGSGEIQHPDEEAPHSSLSNFYGAVEEKSPHLALTSNPTVTLDPKPHGKLQKRKKRNNRRLRKHLKQVGNVKPLPLLPKNSNEVIELVVGKIYAVTEKYESKLVDEINISMGEYVKVLATHTDGWCLAEKCEKDGLCSSFLNKSDEKRSGTRPNRSDENYLNVCRGIIPGCCLKEV